MARRYGRRQYSRDASSSSGGRGASGIKKALPWLIGTSAALFLFWPRAASAATTPAGTTAKVNVAEGLNMRSAAALAGKLLKTIPNGATVTVLQTGITPSDGSGGEWWQISSDGIDGFSRAVDPQGIHNFTQA